MSDFNEQFVEIPKSKVYYVRIKDENVKTLDAMLKDGYNVSSAVNMCLALFNNNKTILKKIFSVIETWRSETGHYELNGAEYPFVELTEREFWQINFLQKQFNNKV